CCQPCGALLPHLFTLTGAEALRRLFSVALSVGSRLPGVTWHFALWSPDFPPSRPETERNSDCPIDSPGARVSLPVGDRNLISREGDRSIDGVHREAGGSVVVLRCQRDLVKQVLAHTGAYRRQRSGALDRQCTQQQLEYPPRLAIHRFVTLRRLPAANHQHALAPLLVAVSLDPGTQLRQRQPFEGLEGLGQLSPQHRRALRSEERRVGKACRCRSIL